MLRIEDRGKRCGGLTRREWLRVGGLGLCGLSLPQLLKAQPSPDEKGGTFGRAKAVIVLFLSGGPPQHETFDPKPDAPAEIRGPFKPINTSVPGVQVCELMPRTARLLHKLAVLRAVSTDDNAHSSSGYAMLTGVPHQPRNMENARPGAPNDWPSLAGIVKKLRPGGALPSAVRLPEHIWNDGMIVWPGQDGGFLGRSADPWLLHCQPQQPDFSVAGLALPPELPSLRLEGRLGLREQLDRHLDAVERSPALTRFDVQTRQAFDLLRAGKARRAFNLHEEPAKLRERYGMTRWGQSCLLARRLVEAGVSLVQVNWTRQPYDAGVNPAWDTHVKNAPKLKNHLMPEMDLSYSALLEDLDARGLLDQTLVVLTGEFGRTPKINVNGGRDHWGPVFSVALAGAGTRGGVVHGASDRIGGHARDGKTPPQDLHATILHCLGHAPDTEIHDSLGRPVPISRGQVIRPILR
jgi:hypothetical protein